MNHFSEYKKQNEPEKYQKAENWGVAIGLQQVDNLTPSKYLIDVAKDNIEGKITIDEANHQVSQYYKKNPAKTVKEQDEKEADEVSARIAKLLSTHTFSFRPSEFISIHKALFTGIFSKEVAGKVRKFDIVKEEPILNGNTVVYGRADSIMETLEYDFKQEKEFVYQGLSKEEKVAHLAKFVSGIWQIHPFAEGNTRTTAVFIIKYLYTLGFETNNDMFEAHAKY
ncbi:MAG: Fic family protein, partial [Alphaproteobacteria bacterium]|nr:Fic family protein [Alphaproteobacteria bacterium]